jgi:hypothetical protein
MSRQRTYLRLTLVISILLGILLPFVLGVKDPTIIIIAFCSAWFIYSIIFFVHTFLISGRRNLKKRLREGINDGWGYS